MEKYKVEVLNENGKILDSYTKVFYNYTDAYDYLMFDTLEYQAKITKEETK